MGLSITDLKKGTLFVFQNEPYRVVDYNQKVMGRGGSIVNVRIKNLIDGKVLDKTFKGNEQLDTANVNNQTVQYLYKDADNYYFMNETNFEQYSIPLNTIKDLDGFLKEGNKVTLSLFNDNPINIELPKNISLRVTYTEDIVKGDTSNAVTKDAELETGLLIKAPSFIKTGDLISVDTSNGSYRERIK